VVAGSNPAVPTIFSFVAQSSDGFTSDFIECHIAQLFSRAVEFLRALLCRGITQ